MPYITGDDQTPSPSSPSPLHTPFLSFPSLPSTSFPQQNAIHILHALPARSPTIPCKANHEPGAKGNKTDICLIYLSIYLPIYLSATVWYLRIYIYIYSPTQSDPIYFTSFHFTSTHFTSTQPNPIHSPTQYPTLHYPTIHTPHHPSFFPQSRNPPACIPGAGGDEIGISFSLLFSWSGVEWVGWMGGLDGMDGWDGKEKVGAYGGGF